MNITSLGEEVIQVDTPPSTCYATPGPYMLFASSDLECPRSHAAPAERAVQRVLCNCDASESMPPLRAERRV